MFEEISQTTMLIVALILITIMSYFMLSLYDKHSIDKDGKVKSFSNTIKSIFGLEEDKPQTPPPIKDTKPEQPIIKKEDQSLLTKPSNLLQNKQKEVYNIDNNEFTYEEAPLVCKAFNSELATYDQLNQEFKKGANWCNYGWTQNQLALYPTQQSFYEELQKGPEEKRNSCGNPGINGGYFSNKDLKFGVNCYGIKPEADPGKLITLEDQADDKTKSKAGLPTEADKKVSDIKAKFSRGDLDIRPFSNEKWSSYSFKKSIYVINPRNTNMTVQDNLSDKEKDPRKYAGSNDTKDDVL
jgi:hypothetical protein